MARDPDRQAWLEELAEARGQASDGFRYSRFVSVAKFALPALALSAIGVIALWPTLEEFGRTEIGLARLDISNLDRTPMLNALFQSTDESERPFQVAAVSAKPSAAGEAMVELDRPTGMLSLDNGGDLSVEADTGLFDREARQLELFGAVRLRSHDGHELRTSLAFVDFTRGYAHGKTPVAGNGPSGALASEGFTVIDGGAVIVFQGPATALLIPAAPGVEDGS